MKINLPGAKIAKVTCLITLLAASVQAESVLIDFGSSSSFRGVSVPNPDVNGNYWNSITPGPFFPDLINNNNSSTTFDISFDTPVGTDSFNGPAGATSFPNPTPTEIATTDIDAIALGNLGIKEAAIDFAASPGGADNRTRFQIQQLDPLKIYNLTFFGSHKFSDNDATVYSVYTDNTYSTLVASISLNVQTPGSPHLHNRDQVAVLNGLLPQNGNTLYVEFVGASGGLGYLNAMEIEVVPEPGSIALLSGGVLLFLARRRIKS